MDATVPARALPEGLDAFLVRSGWAGAAVEPLPGDASARRYFRLRDGAADGAARTAMLMDAPAPGEDPRPFLRAARWLDTNGLRPPRILAADEAAGLVLLEDFGTSRVRDYLDAWPLDEAHIYRGAVDTLLALHELPPGPFRDYSLAEYTREARLFVDWYCPAQALAVDGASYNAAWEAALRPLLTRQRPGVTVLRDYHAENLMLLGSLDKQGLLDFQDALIGHRAYDLVSLLQDARRDVSAETQGSMLDHYLARSGRDRADFLEDYALLGAQRNAKIVGIFVRLARRDGKMRYLEMIPRVWAHLESDLAHPACAPVAAWFAAYIPAPLRAAGGGSFAA